MTKKNNRICIEILKSTQQWPSLKKPIQEIVLKTLSESGYIKLYQKNIIEVSIALADDKFMQDLNLRFRGKNKPTNVLSFPDETSFNGTTRYLGDVALAYETVKSEAKIQGKPFKHHVMHLITHGLLHLIGYDHETEKEAQKMEELEARILQHFGVKNPYD